MRWFHIDEKKPFATGRYWVYPFVTLDGHRIVAMVSFKNEKWENTAREQQYLYWQKIEAPKPPFKDRKIYA